MTSQEIAVRGAATVVQQTAQDLEAAYRIAEALGRTAFVPQHFRGKTEDAMAAILYGQTIGMDPMTALQNLYVIGGKPALYARPMVGIVLSQGHEIWTEEMSDAKVVVCGRRKGTEHIERSEWTIDRARLAGYTSNKKYMTDPQSMLYARASGDVARRVAPDALLGMAYNVEELEASQELEQQNGPGNVTPMRRPNQNPRTLTEAVAPAEQVQVDVASVVAAAEQETDPDRLVAMYQSIANAAGDEAAEARNRIVELGKAARARQVEQEQSEPAPEEPTMTEAEVAEALDAEIVEAS